MALEVTGKLLQKLPVQSGQSAKGAWSKQEFIFETQENFPRKVCFSVWGSDKVAELMSFAEGETIKVGFNLESRSYNERWFTEARAWRIERVGVPANVGAPLPHDPPPRFEPSYLDPSSGSEIDDLPF